MRKVGTASAGEGPFALALSPDDARLYVANVRSGDVTVIATGTLTTLSTVKVGAMPYGVAVTADGRFVVVSRQHAGAVAVIAADGLAPLGDVSVGRYPEGVLALADGRVAVANWFSGDLSFIDPQARRELARLPLADGPRGLAVALR